MDSALETGRKTVKTAKKSRKWDKKMMEGALGLARSGMPDGKIAQALGATAASLAAKLSKDSDFAAGMEAAREQGSKTFAQALAGRLPPGARALWDRLEALGGMIDGPEKRGARADVFAALDEAPARVRMHLFVQALAHVGFIPGEACRVSGVSPSELARWRAQDKDFREIMEGMMEAKRDFFESCLVGLCRRGDSAAIIFANRTSNRGRGYGDRLEVEVKTEVTHTHRLTLDDLPPEAKRAMLDAYRRKRDAAQIGYNDGAPDAEFEEVG